MIKKIKGNQQVIEFFRFVIVGIAPTSIHYGIYLTLDRGLHFSHNISYTLGYLISFIFNFISSTIFTFQTKITTKNGVKFSVAHVINYFVHMTLLNFFIYIRVPAIIAPIFVFPIAILINFFMVRFALKKREN